MNFLLDSHPSSTLYSYTATFGMSEKEIFHLKKGKIGVYGRMDPTIYNSLKELTDKGWRKTEKEALEVFIKIEEKKIDEMSKEICRARKLIKERDY